MLSLIVSQAMARPCGVRGLRRAGREYGTASPTAVVTLAAHSSGDMSQGCVGEVEGVPDDTGEGANDEEGWVEIVGNPVGCGVNPLSGVPSRAPKDARPPKIAIARIESTIQWSCMNRTKGGTRFAVANISGSASTSIPWSPTDLSSP